METVVPALLRRTPAREREGSFRISTVDTSIQTLLPFSWQTSEAAAFLTNSGQVQLGSLLLASRRILGLKGESDDQTTGSLQGEKYWGQVVEGRSAPLCSMKGSPPKAFLRKSLCLSGAAWWGQK